MSRKIVLSHIQNIETETAVDSGGTVERLKIKTRKD